MYSIEKEPVISIPWVLYLYYILEYLFTIQIKFIIRIEISDWVTPSGTTTNQEWPSIQLTYITHDPTLRAIKKEIYGSVVVKCKKNYIL